VDPALGGKATGRKAAGELGRTVGLRFFDEVAKERVALAAAAEAGLFLKEKNLGLGPPLDIQGKLLHHREGGFDLDFAFGARGEEFGDCFHGMLHEVREGRQGSKPISHLPCHDTRKELRCQAILGAYLFFNRGLQNSSRFSCACSFQPSNLVGKGLNYFLQPFFPSGGELSFDYPFFEHQPVNWIALVVGDLVFWQLN
jgi:hypothetical protein